MAAQADYTMGLFHLLVLDKHYLRLVFSSLRNPKLLIMKENHNLHAK